MSIYGIDPTARRSRKAGAIIERVRRRHLIGGILSGAESLWNTASDAVTGATSGAGDVASGALSSAADAATNAATSSGGGLWGALTNFFGPIGDFFGFGSGSGTGAATMDPMDIGGAAKDASWTQASDINGASGLGLAKPAALDATSAGVAPIASSANRTALALAALSTIGKMMSKPKIGTWQTPGPSSNAANLGPYYNQGLNMNMPGRTPVASPLPTSSTGAPANYWAYGGPEQTYFAGNSLRNYGFAHGGALHLAHGGPEFSTDTGANLVRGPGDGQSDSVPARLSNGEYVLTAADVSRLGNGSNEAGAKRLDEFRKHLAQQSGQKQFIPARTGGALSHLMAGA